MNSAGTGPSGNRWKKIVYEYDLISGKVNTVTYQPDYYNAITQLWIKPVDQFNHRYSYDAENRLTLVETSTDKLVWEKDATYSYYKHGPLARVNLGELQVQGVDYAYTLQGWLKGVNSTSVNAGILDMGLDGKLGSPNNNVARDAYGFSLNYFNSDYKPVGGSSLNTFTGNTFNLTNTNSNAVAAELFNGNIAAMVVNIPKLGDANTYGYKYDQLNRIVSMDAFTGLNNGSNTFIPITTANYKERVTYDANGNIKTYLRNGDAARPAMDNMTYSYKANTNQLYKVVDAATDVAASEYDKYNDIKQGQTNGNYQYDSIGNLISDVSEGITNISWSVYGKIQSITKASGTISYSYDASGNRISKTANNKTTWYVRDASGNVMSIYSKDAAVNSGDLTQTELHLYGSSRLGVLNTSTNVQSIAANPGGSTTFTRGNKFFELSNHLGNVLVTVSDKKLQHSTDGTTIDYYNADIATANDYYPFGMGMPGRKYSAGSTYRYGFNGKEKDKDIANDDYDYGARIYDARLGRWLSTDPLQIKYPSYSPYVFCLNNPIFYLDILGKDVLPSSKFCESRYGSIYDNLLLNSATFGNILKPYFNSKTLNLILDINDEAVKSNPDDAFALTSGPKKSQKVTTIKNITKGTQIVKKGPVMLTSNTIESYSNDLASEKEKETKSAEGVSYLYKTKYSDIFIASSIIHESLHALVDYDQKGILNPPDTKSGGHTELNSYRDLFVTALSEYVKNSNLKFSVQDIEDLVWHGTEKSTQFNAHFEELSQKNKTTKEDEISLWKGRVSKLAFDHTTPVKKEEPKK